MTSSIPNFRLTMKKSSKEFSIDPTAISKDNNGPSGKASLGKRGKGTEKRSQAKNNRSPACVH